MGRKNDNQKALANACAEVVPLTATAAKVQNRFY
jgi:hypothetical protein